MNFFKGLNLALQFTTRIPGWPITNYNEKDLGKSGVYFPIIGLLIGAILYGEYLLLLKVNLVTAVILLLATEMVISGGLHLDGFMDTMDGMLSGTTGEKMLSIMADSNVGAHSVSSLFILILTKIAFLITILSINPFVVIVLPFLGRTFMLLSIVLFPYPKKEGIGVIYKKNLQKPFVAVMTMLSFALIIYLIPVAIFAIILTFVTIYVFSKKVTFKIGGLTGDVYGAIEELSQVIFLMFLFITYSIGR